MDLYKQLVLDKIEELRQTDPDKAEKLAAALKRLEEAEARLEEMSKDDELALSRVRRYGVLR